MKKFIAIAALLCGVASADAADIVGNIDEGEFSMTWCAKDGTTIWQAETWFVLNDKEIEIEIDYISNDPPFFYFDGKKFVPCPPK
jgi:hypothetical protein